MEGGREKEDGEGIKRGGGGAERRRRREGEKIMMMKMVVMERERGTHSQTKTECG